ncbi:MAG: transglycosylase domain-containing protein [Leptospiraceae bacterium]|nr:transglycosylase domain-containing protein [Leptospiraceae bacterium]
MFRFFIQVTLAAILLDFFFHSFPGDDWKKKLSVVMETKEGRSKSFLSKDSSHNEFLELKNFPTELVENLISIEDKRYYYHLGIDPIAIVRAIYWNYKHGKIISGASTITQQTVRILYSEDLPKDKYLRKLVEILFSIRAEVKFNKSEILEIYLNLVPFQGNIEGFSRASKFYFQKDVKFLTKEEMVSLVLLLRELKPTKEKFFSRLDKYFVNDPNSLDKAYIEKKLFDQKKFVNKEISSSMEHVTDWFYNYFNNTPGRFKSSISENLNSKIQGILNIENKFIKDYNAKETAAIVLKVNRMKKRLELVALVGSLNYEKETGQVNGAIHQRDAGSTLKPFVFALGFEEGKLFPNSIMKDEETRFKAYWQKGAYIPRNNDQKFWGTMTASEALANSRNVPAVQAIEKVGVEKFLDFLREIEINHLKHDYTDYGFGLALGTGGISLLQLTRGYSIFASDGTLFPLYLGESNQGEILFGKEKKIFSNITTSEIKHILSNNDLRKRAFGERNFLEFPFPVASKTGTSKDFRDAWSIGFTDEYVVSVWVGNFDGKPMDKIYGAFGAGRSMHQIFRLLAEKEKLSLNYSQELTEVKVCRLSGKLAGRSCNGYLELLPKTKSLSPCDGIHETKISAIHSPTQGDIFVLDPYLPLEHQKVPIKISILPTSNNVYSYQIFNNKEIKIEKDVNETIFLKEGSYSISLKKDNTVIQKVEFVVR